MFQGHSTVGTNYTFKIQNTVLFILMHGVLKLNLIQLKCTVKQRLLACQRGDAGCQYMQSAIWNINIILTQP